MTPSARARRARVVAAERVLAGGGTCLVQDGEAAILVHAVEPLDEPGLRDWLAARPPATLLLTGTRAQALGLLVPTVGCVALELDPEIAPATLLALVGPGFPGGGRSLPDGSRLRRATRVEEAAVDLAKRAGLIPAVLARAATGDVRADIAVEAEAILARSRDDLATLRPLVEARLPIAATERARLVLFRSASGAVEHLALVVGEPERRSAPLVRLHSECFTGDVFGSLRCDCGAQLDAALAQMAEEGAGVLVYLRQEGRGIGLLNKLRAYRLQDQGLDTVDANTHLGFLPDERDYAFAAKMLRLLGIERLRLITNNPEKLEALARHGVAVVERVPSSVPPNRHNRFYLETKARRSGHLLRLCAGGLNGLPVEGGAG
ncbi:MAG: GTP cyclohydrolase II [Geminicoccaceae bacterium]|nr:GTP cyclohydrolase II [Geminicoccaceae bacterium]MDW8340978.1 GTP cyclohydrolase II [Geminicoccaceae bacterium]